MTTMEPSIADVSDTSYWVAYYRAKESERPDAMFRDPLAKILVGERGKRIAESMADLGRHTEWAVISRTVIIDEFIQELISEGVTAVLNIGAGLDTRPYRMNLPATLEWIEADYPHIVAKKNELLANEKAVCRLTRVAVDLADAEQRRKFLSASAPGAAKVLVITEGVMPYLGAEQVTDLARDLLTQSRYAYWITEYFHPRVYRFLKASLRSQKMRNAPFRFYPADWFGFFASLGWKKRDLRYSEQIAERFGRRSPMPWWGRVVLTFVPAKVRDEMKRMTGYTVLERAT